eukprot:gene31793-42404_t
METTQWENYGVGKNPKCDNCMAHCGFEGTAVNDTFANPLKAARVALFGPDIDGPMAPDLPILYGNRSDAAAVRIPISAITKKAKPAAEKVIEMDAAFWLAVPAAVMWFGLWL